MLLYLFILVFLDLGGITKGSLVQTIRVIVKVQIGTILLAVHWN